VDGVVVMTAEELVDRKGLLLDARRDLTAKQSPDALICSSE
jgi:hypothetical protein